MELSTNRLIIKDLSREDKDFFNGLLEENNNRNYFEAGLFEYALKDKLKCIYSVFDKNGNYLGMFGYDIISTMNEYKLCKIYMLYHEKYWNNHIATEVLGAMLEYMIMENSCLKIVAPCSNNNKYYMRLLLNNGFVKSNNIDQNTTEYKITKPIYLQK